jgi:catechol 2,3-dioxygenase-like lactoylglutathione lyase family enzyme
MLQQVHPVLPSRDVQRSIDFYVGRLGFSLSFHYPEKPAYAGVIRDGVDLHLQWHDDEEWERTERPMLRFLVTDIDALYEELGDAGVFHEHTALEAKPWGTREFGFLDPDNNGLTFYMLL